MVTNIYTVDRAVNQREAPFGTVHSVQYRCRFSIQMLTDSLGKLNIYDALIAIVIHTFKLSIQDNSYLNNH